MSLSMRAGPDAPQTIAGGFVLVPVRPLLAAWRACGRGPLGVGEFRTWLACREMVARRCTLEGGGAPDYGLAELARLTGVSPKRAGVSVRRLAAAGHLAWSDHVIAFPDASDPDDAFDDTIGGGHGSLAIPRRILRLLAGGARPALIATVIAVLLRCLSRGRGGFKARGRVKASWIARAFDVDVRRVKQARKELVALGWVVPEETDQWAENRWGRAYRIDLGWGRAGTPTDGRRLPPPPADAGPRLPPPDSDPEPLRGEKNQEPAPGGSAGIEIREGQETPVPSPPSVPTAPHRRAGGKPRHVPRGSVAIADAAGGAPPAPPTLNHVRAEDLKDAGRLFQLYQQAVGRRLVGSSEADRLRFFGAAEHALGAGKANPPGLFMSLVRGRLWRNLTQGDEDAAAGRLKRLLFGPPRGVRASPRSAAPAEARPRLSADAMTVREVRAAATRAGYRGDPFPMVRSRDGTWTRARWDDASAELERSRDWRPRG